MRVNDVEKVVLLDYDPEVSMEEINAVKVKEKMNAERYAEEKRLVEEAKDVAVVLVVKQKVVGVREKIMASKFEYQKVATEMDAKAVPMLVL